MIVLKLQSTFKNETATVVSEVFFSFRCIFFELCLCTYSSDAINKCFFFLPFGESEKKFFKKGLFIWETVQVNKPVVYVCTKKNI